MDPVLLFLLSFAAIFIVGIAGEMVFAKTGVPDVIWLMLVGIIIGPVLHLVSREQLLTIGPYFGALTLVVVLFEGGSTLRLGEVAGALPRSSLLAAVGFVITVGALAGASMIAALLGLLPGTWTWLHGIVLGAMLGGSSSVVIMPALSKTKLSPRLANLITVESALTDVLCVVITVAAVNIVVTGSADAGEAGLILVRSLGVGLGFGLLVGMAWLLFLRKLSSSPHAYPATLAILLILYVVVDSLGGNAALAILAAAILVGNAPTLAPSVGLQHGTSLSDGVQDTHTQITFIIKSFFFTFIGAMLGPPWGLVAVGAVFAGVLFFARIPTVAIGAARGGYSRADKGMMGVAIPRGMAAGVLALLPHAQGVPGTANLPVVVFSAVLVSILIFAGGFPIMARRLEREAAAGHPASPDASDAPAVDPALAAATAGGATLRSITACAPFNDPNPPGGGSSAPQAIPAIPHATLSRGDGSDGLA